jgi:murein L,D-transpeptidase YcbB/YkuD
MMKLSSNFLTAGTRFLRRACLALAVAAVGTAASAQGVDPIGQALLQNAAEWQDGFDTGNVVSADVRTRQPILSSDTVWATEIAIQQYTQIVQQGGWPVVPADKQLRLGMRDPAVVLLRQRLAVSGDLPQNASSGDAFDSYVEAAVRRFQARHGIPADGIIGRTTFDALNIPASVRLGQLQRNLERLKDLTAHLPSRFLMVNIPGAEVEAVENGQVVSRHTAIVGKVDRASPLVNSRVTEINFNPFWTVPASIIERDLIPLMQQHPDYLAQQHIHVYNQQGVELMPEQIDWNTNEAVNYLFRQDPGDFNSLGSVKINFPSPDGVYMHDTPNKTLFGNEYRFESSGCVRVQNIHELIVWLLRDTPGWDRNAIDQVFHSGERLDVKVTDPIELHWVYISAWARADGIVQFRNDIYNADGLDQLALR